MLRMQRDAEMRVHQMRNRARSVTMTDSEIAPELNRNWSTATGRSRQLPSQPIRPPGRQFPRGMPVQDVMPANENPPAEQVESPEPPQQVNQGNHGRARQNRREQNASPPPPQGDGTILGDVMGALGMEDDTLLIIGLLLILLNQKADTTLLLALAYLLI